MAAVPIWVLAASVDTAVDGLSTGSEVLAGTSVVLVAVAALVATRNDLARWALLAVPVLALAGALLPTGGTSAVVIGPAAALYVAWPWLTARLAHAEAVAACPAAAGEWAGSRRVTGWVVAATVATAVVGVLITLTMPRGGAFVLLPLSLAVGLGAVVATGSLLRSGLRTLRLLGA